MKELELKVTGLACASCAANIEKQAKEISDLQDVSIDLMNNNVKIKISDKSKEKEILEKLNKLADKIEPGSKIAYKSLDSVEVIKKDYTLARIIFSTLFLGLGLLIKQTDLSFFVLMIAYVVVGYDVVILAVKKIFRGQAMDEHFLMTIATIGAIAIGERFEAVLVMLLYQIGEFFQDRAVDQSKRSITSLMDIRPDFANKLTNGIEVMVDPQNVLVDDIIIVRPGEKVALDGIVIEGISSIDAKALTGESLFRTVEVGSEVLSGVINIEGVLKIKVTKAYFESTVSKILDLVENASANKAKSETYIAKFAKYYTPIVVAIAFVLAFIVPLILKGVLFDYDYIYRSLTFLVISCPCALVISVPLSFFGGIGGASKEGILFKGSNYIEALAKVDTVVFDKTGTLTHGNFVVSSVMSNHSREKVLEMAAMAEYYSNHPIALSIVKAYGKPIDQNLISNVEEIAHHGVSVNYDDKQILAGNYKLMMLKYIDVAEINSQKSIVYVAVDNEFFGAIVVEDEIKPQSPIAINNLKAIGINKIEMLTGDSKSIADEVGATLGLSKVYSQLYPADKVDIVQKYLNSNEAVVFVGDGINDAPVLTLASVGVAMGALGSDAAIEAADVVIMDDDPAKLAVAIKHSQRTLRIVKQNITFAIGIKLLFLLLGGLGISSMAMAVFADVGVSILAILNAIRLLKVK